MAYQPNDPRGLAGAGLGCGPGCGCRLCRSSAGNARRLGESYETDDDDDDAPTGAGGRVGEVPVPAMARALAPTPAMGWLVEVMRLVGARAATQQLLADGVRDENRLTDLLFFARHPERRGRRIAQGETQAAAQWRQMRDLWVRPALRQSRPARPTGPAAPRHGPALPTAQPQAAPGACPTGDPLPPGTRRPVGRVCSAAGRKCWPAQGKSLDIVDADLPCTAARNPGAYRAVLDYFNVADSANLRYARTPTSTFCNIFAHDATRALRAPIPHWVRDDRQRTSRPIGWNEINANSTFDWLLRGGPAAGWMPIDAGLIAAVQRLAASRGADGVIAAAAGRVLDAALARLPGALASAAQRIARARHADPALLAQDSYLAQQFANLGFPSVVAWKNPSGRSGHIALVRPESAGSIGALHRLGMYLPRSTQAGARNFEDGLADWIAGRNTRSRRFFVHA